MSHRVTAVESFLSAAFKGFIALIVSLVLASGYGLIIMSGPVFLGIILSLLVAGLGLYIFSDYKMRTMAAMEEPKDEKEDKEEKEDTSENAHGMDIMLVSVIGVELASIMTKNSTLMSIFLDQWWMPVVLAGGIFFYYGMSLLVLNLRLFSSGEDPERMEEYYKKMAIAHKKFLYDLCAVIPQIIIAALIMNTFTMHLLAASLMVSGPIGIAVVVVVLCIAAYYFTVQKDLKAMHEVENVNAQNSKLVLHENYFVMNKYVKQVLIRLIVGLMLSTSAGLLLLNAPYIVASSALVFTIVAGILLGAAIYTSYRRSADFKSKIYQEEPGFKVSVRKSATLVPPASIPVVSSKEDRADQHLKKAEEKPITALPFKISPKGHNAG